MWSLSDGKRQTTLSKPAMPPSTVDMQSTTSVPSPSYASSSSQVNTNVPEPLALRNLSAFETSVCAVLSKLSAFVVTYPSQVVR